MVEAWRAGMVRVRSETPGAHLIDNALAATVLYLFQNQTFTQFEACDI